MESSPTSSISDGAYDNLSNDEEEEEEEEAGGGAMESLVFEDDSPMDDSLRAMREPLSGLRVNGT